MASVQERLRGAREEVTETGPIRLAWPGFKDDSLIIRYRPVEDWATMQAFLRTQPSDDEDAPVEIDPVAASRQMNVAVDTLLRACDGCEAHIDGEVTELPHRLGRDLAEYLDFDVAPLEAQVVTDRQAVFLMVPKQTELMQHYSELLTESGGPVTKADRRVEGESPPS